jgi:hypothetical protein
MAVERAGHRSFIVPGCTGVRDLVTKLKIFRYEGERRLRLIADYANSEECRSVFIRRYIGEE